MRIILMQDVKSVGKIYDVKEVKDGFARNFLLARKLAVLATAKNLANLQTKMRDATEKAKAETIFFQQIAEKLQNLKLEFKMKMGVKGETFGSINQAKVQQALKEKGFAVDKDWIQLDTPIKKASQQQVSLKFPHNISAEISVTVVPEKTSKPAKDKKKK